MKAYFLLKIQSMLNNNYRHGVKRKTTVSPRHKTTYKMNYDNTSILLVHNLAHVTANKLNIL